jgi:hypothetical protein
MPLLALFIAMAGCGYHVGGKADTMPKSIQTIAVLPFNNLSSRYKLSDKMQQAISREMISRTRFQVTRDPSIADAILSGTINSVATFPVVFDPATNKTTVVQVSVLLQLSLRERVSGKTLYNRPQFEVRNNYEVSLFPTQYFDESTLALDRISADLARTVVSGILENF